MDDEPTGGPDDAADGSVDEIADEIADETARRNEQQAEDEIIDLPWDDDLPVALGDDGAVEGDATSTLDAGPSDDLTGETGGRSGVAADAEDAGDAEGTDGAAAFDDSREADPIDAGEDLGDLYDDDHVAGRRNALPRRVESWRSRSASGAIATAIAMGLQQVFEPERRRPAAVAEAPSDPYDDDDPITVDYVPDDAEATTVHVKPWLLQKGEPG